MSRPTFILAGRTMYPHVSYFRNHKFFWHFTGYEKHGSPQIFIEWCYVHLSYSESKKSVFIEWIKLMLIIMACEDGGGDDDNNHIDGDNNDDDDNNDDNDHDNDDDDGDW